MDSKTSELNQCIFRFFNAAGAHQDSVIGEAHDPETHLVPTILNGVIQSLLLNVFGQDFNTKDGTAVRDYVQVTDIANTFTRL